MPFLGRRRHDYDLAKLGPPLEHDPMFPERANISVAQVRRASTSCCAPGSAAPVLTGVRIGRLRGGGRRGAARSHRPRV
jgi:diaminopimelate epimerase